MVSGGVAVLAGRSWSKERVIYGLERSGVARWEVRKREEIGGVRLCLAMKSWKVLVGWAKIAEGSYYVQLLPTWCPVFHKRSILAGDGGDT